MKEGNEFGQFHAFMRLHNMNNSSFLIFPKKRVNLVILISFQFFLSIRAKSAPSLVGGLK